MNRIFVAADTHFGHAKAVEFRPFKSIEDHDLTIVERWNAAVKPKDTVWHLGDVYFGGAKAHGVLGALNGTKRLVMGNHDGYPLELYLQYFTRVCGIAELKGCVLSHMPVHPNQLETRYRLNVHGHMHSHQLEDSRYRCVSMEQINYTPVMLDEVIL